MIMKKCQRCHKIPKLAIQAKVSYQQTENPIVATFKWQCVDCLLLDNHVYSEAYEVVKKEMEIIKAEKRKT